MRTMRWSRRRSSPFGARVLPVPAGQDALSALADKNVFAVLTRERRIDPALYSDFPGLKLILRYGVGVDNVDLKTATERRIHVANIPDYGAENEVSDHVIALYLAVARRIVTRDGRSAGGPVGCRTEEPGSRASQRDHRPDRLRPDRTRRLHPVPRTRISPACW